MSFLRLPKIVLLRTPLVDSEGVLGVFEMENADTGSKSADKKRHMATRLETEECPRKD